MVLPTVNQPPPQRLLRPRTLGQWAQGQILLSLIVWPWILLAYGPMSLSPRKLDRDRLDPPEIRTYPILGAISRFLWASGGMVLLLSLIPFSQIVTIPTMLVVIARWSARPYGLPLRDLVARGTRLIRTSDRWRIVGWVAVGGLGIVVLLVVVAGIASATGMRLPSELALGFWAGLAPVLVGAALAREAGSDYKADAAAAERRTYAVAAAVGGLLGMPAEKAIEAGLYSANVDGSITISPVPPRTALRGRDAMETDVATILPEMTVASFDAQSITLTAAPDEVLRARETMALSGGLLVAVQDDVDTAARPEAVRWTLDSGVSPAQAPMVATLARQEGMELVEWSPYERYAVAAKLTPLTRQVRDAVAAGFGSSDRPWDVEVEVSEGTEPDAPVASVRILRTPAGMADRRARALADALQRIPGGHEEWLVDDNLQSGIATLAWKKRPELPAVVEGRELLPAPGTVGDRDRLPVGRYADGTEMIADLKAGPHTMVVGSSGTGKSTFTRLMLVQALARGYELVYADAPKRGAGLYGIEPYARAWETSGSRAAVASLMSSVYDEVQRRVALIAAHRAEDWSDLPAELGIRPILVVIDEFRGHVAVATKAPAAKGTEAFERWEEASAAAASILDSVGSMASEARSAGIRLVLLTQRPDAIFIPGDVRDNLGTTIQLVNPQKTPSAQALGMSFGGDSDLVHLAQEQIRRFNNGRPGFAVTAVEGGAVAASRIGYLRYSVKDGVDEAAEILTERGIPAGVPLAYEAPQPKAPRFGAPVANPEDVFFEPVSEEEIDMSDLLGDFDFGSLDVDGFTPPDLSEGWNA